MKHTKKLAVLFAGLLAVTGAQMLPASAAASAQETYADAVVSLVNAERAAAGLAPVKAAPVLNDAALVRSGEIVQYFSHTRPDGRACQTVLTDMNVDWRACGENIAYGYPDAEAVMDGWMHSEGHRANILNASFEYIGVGVVEQGGTLYWTQVFTGGAEPAGAYLPGGTAETPTAPETVTPVRPSVPAQTVTPAAPQTQCSGTDCTPCIGDSCPQIVCIGGNCDQNGACGSNALLDCLKNDNCSSNALLDCLKNGNCSSNALLDCLKNGSCGSNGFSNVLTGGSCPAANLFGALTCGK